ncbi:MAG: NADH:flavin oxidoreductase/NADH oxidase [Actinomycetales bacterium]|nr:NADH:flavin oxidoreductase/NADH oxidase [Actinomycetales bacterium]
MVATHVFSPLSIRSVTFRNRLWVSPMCMYSCTDGFANEFHRVHTGQYALGGAGLVMMEATGVVPEGRITADCMGLWSDAHAESLAPAVAFAQTQGARVGIQLAHAGRKASANAPHRGPGFVSAADGGWTPLGPTEEPFRGLAGPRAATAADLEAVVAGFAAAARRAVSAGFDVIEVHGAHGYLLHQFASPLVNTRTDAWGGAGRTKLALDVADAVRSAIPDSMPLFYRVSATDWVDGGWSVDDTVELSVALRAHGVDLIDVSSGGAVPDAAIPVAPGYQVPLAKQVRERAGVLTSAVGLIDEAAAAEQVLASGAADAVMMGRRWLRDPYSGVHFADALGVDAPWPRQYARR